MFCERITLKSGKVSWRCIADGPRNPVTGKRRQIERRGKTRREARQRVEDVLRSLEEDGIDERLSKSITFEQVAKKWLDVYAISGVKPGSIRIREKEVNILCKYFAKVPIIDVTHNMYQNALKKLNEDGNNGKPYAENTIKGVNTCANMIFNHAIKNKLIKDNPREGAVVPKNPISIEDLKNNSIEEKFFNSDELELFLDAVLKYGSELDKERFFTLAFTGMRPGELIALKKTDLDFVKNTISIYKTVYNPDNNMREYELVPTKTNVARTINVDKRIMNMLKKLIHKNDIHKMKYQTTIEDFHDGNFVFQRKNGYPFITKNIADRMEKIMGFIKVEKKLTPHSLRHTYISLATEAGVDLPTIMKTVGHEDPNTTLKIYTHVTEKMEAKAAKKVDSTHSHLLKKVIL